MGKNKESRENWQMVDGKKFDLVQMVTWLALSNQIRHVKRLSFRLRLTWINLTGSWYYQRRHIKVVFKSRCHNQNVRMAYENVRTTISFWKPLEAILHINRNDEGKLLAIDSAGDLYLGLLSSNQIQVYQSDARMITCTRKSSCWTWIMGINWHWIISQLFIIFWI